MTGAELDRATRDALYRGANLFNAGAFWDAHEAWEDAWMEADGDLRVFLQGLIQVAAGFHKVVQDNPRGCAKLLGTGLDKLNRVEAAFAGIDPAFRDRVSRCLDEAVRWRDGGAGAFDRSLIPHLGFVG